MHIDIDELEDAVAELRDINDMRRVRDALDYATSKLDTRAKDLPENTGFSDISYADPDEFPE